jgi:hypothetical protein
VPRIETTQRKGEMIVRIPCEWLGERALFNYGVFEKRLAGDLEWHRQIRCRGRSSKHSHGLQRLPVAGQVEDQQEARVARALVMEPYWAHGEG